MSNNKMKGLLKGLRYISQIFDNEKEPEMQIGFPTDVKHVAHIGWDGPSVNSPSWMDEFKAAPGSLSSSAPLNSKGEPEDDDNASWVSEDSTRRISKSGKLDGETSGKPKSRRNSSSGGLGIEESALKEKSEKPKQRRSSKTGTKDGLEGKSIRQKDSDPANLPKKSRRKKSKDISSKASRSKSQAVDGDCGSDCGSVSRSVHNDNSECGSNVSANFSALEDETEHHGTYNNGIC